MLACSLVFHTGLVLSDPYAHKCCKISGIKSQSKHYSHKKPGEPGKINHNLILAELNVDGPLQCIVSNMTMFWLHGVSYELTIAAKNIRASFRVRFVNGTYNNGFLRKKENSPFRFSLRL